MAKTRIPFFARQFRQSDTTPFQGDLSLFQAWESLKKLVALSMLIVDSSTQGDQIQ
jgi:hypothetical protein